MITERQKTLVYKFMDALTFDSNIVTEMDIFCLSNKDYVFDIFSGIVDNIKHKNLKDQHDAVVCTTLVTQATKHNFDKVVKIIKSYFSNRIKDAEKSTGTYDESARIANNYVSLLEQTAHDIKFLDDCKNRNAKNS